MKTTVTLKQLRTDPRQFVTLLNQGYQIDITEHSKLIAQAQFPERPKTKRGNIAYVLKTVDGLPRTKAPFSAQDTVSVTKRTKRRYMTQKFGS